MNRKPYPLTMEFAVDKLYTFHYYELSKSFYTTGERHDFWELVYVDRGELDLFMDSKRVRLKQGDLVFYAPNVFHGGGAADSAVNAMIVSFESKATCLNILGNKVLQLQKDEQYLLSELLKEGFATFDPPIDTLFYPYLDKREESPFGCEQMIKNYLELLLTKLVRRCLDGSESGGDKLISVVPYDTRKSELLEKIKHYMKERIGDPLTFEQVCADFLMGKTQLKALFKEMTGIGMIQYFNHLKIEEAKSMIRAERYNYTEIAQRLGYSSIHYFSSSFKKAVGMTPSQYARTVQAKARGRE